MRIAGILRIITVSVLLLTNVLGQTVRDPFPVKRTETPDTWRKDGWAALDAAKREKIRKGRAKNVILFLGDGMGITTTTAARIFEGQRRGESGEENRLSFENFPHTAFSKTYNTNSQNSDSASTMSAIVTGVKTDQSVISVDQNVVQGDHRSVEGNVAKTILEYAEESGRSTGVVSTAGLTHATPGACYAHSPDRDWESDADIASRNKAAADAGFPDIARQLIEFKYGDGLEVAFGGSRPKFLPKQKGGERLDGRDLTSEWAAKRPGSAYVSSRTEMLALDPKATRHALGLFDNSHMAFERDRLDKKLDEPSITEMTTKAIDILQQNKKGFFLMVEGGRIDQAHHYGNAYRALSENVEFSNAIRAAVAKVNLDDTLVIVTADHSHSLTMIGYSARGNDILGLVRQIGPGGVLKSDYQKDLLGLPYTTLHYSSGRGYEGKSDKAPEGPKFYPHAPRSFSPKTGREDLTKVDTTDPNYMQEVEVPLADETHGGEDVPIYAIGVDAHLFRGSMEENWIFYVMADAMRVAR
jgi:alkaline phosphatase